MATRFVCDRCGATSDLNHGLVGWGQLYSHPDSRLTDGEYMYGIKLPQPRDLCPGCYTDLILWMESIS